MRGCCGSRARSLVAFTRARVQANGRGARREGRCWSSSSDLGGGGEEEGAKDKVVVPIRRASRLTGSQLANALGWWKGGREQVWEEKLGLREPFRGNDATRWGTKHEPRARDDFSALTGYNVLDAGKDGLALLDKEAGGLVRLHREEGKTWLGAAPDGVIPDMDALLEIKCPYNRGYPKEMKPWDRAPWYYMAQVQSLMEIFDMQTTYFYCWTIEGGSCVYVVERDREYWGYVYAALEEFWHRHLVPARDILLQSDGLDVKAAELYRPREIHTLTEYTKILSQRMVTELEVRPFNPFSAG
ncbi:YqaJ domain-containing protein [Chloropicon primus]|uniref:YqaJ viral recombinase domain-containing protein n=1 Tax=Chloropicon primus TaxID=1764295 RepID=A0A5B8MQN4_9CHLO|nr:hypothetical protein A3770_09p55360 [Chloropicon primus]UPR02236.1 YqaJ domain-containing protein [Chloropicon primus]|eukprot:QDZ23018.1 hypothetical protein A3770_09p55360 [Chloropicon primus]